MDEPRFGYGKGLRPLWSPRDRDAEVIRRVLRQSGFRDVGEGQQHGFAVEGANSSENGLEPFAVMYCGDTDAAMLQRYRDALELAGLQVSVEDLDGNVLLVPRRSVSSLQKVLGPAQRLLAAAATCAVLATMALVASWVGVGQVRLVGGMGSGILGAAAAMLAGLWYRGRLDEQKEC